VTQLFGRAARVTVWEPQPATFFSDPTATNALVIEKLRIEFEVVRSTDKEPDTCELKITNAADDTRARLHKKPLRVRLEAGYGTDLSTLFVGDLIHGASKLDGTDWVTTVQVGDGLRAFRQARVAQSFREGTTAYAALKSVADAMQFSLPVALLDDSDLKSQFAAGITLHGQASTQLTRLLEPFGFRWCVQNGRLVVLRDSESTTGTAIVVDKTSGLIGSPETGAPTKEQKIPITTIKTLLNDQILPGKVIQLTSREHKAALFKVVKTTITGDTFGGDFINTTEAKPR